MEKLTTVTQKGQLTIPVEFRRKYKIEEYGKVLVKDAKDHLKIIPTRDILELAGSFKVRGKKTVLKARDYLEKNYRRV